MKNTKKALEQYTVADLQALKPGTHIVITLNGNETTGRVLAVQPSGRFQARIGAKLAWFDFGMFTRVVAQQPEPAPVAMEPSGLQNLVAAINEIPKEVMAGMKAKMYSPAASTAHLAGKVSEFGTAILKGIAAIEVATEDEAVPTALLAGLMKEPPRRVAAGFVALMRVNAVVLGGKKGAGTVSLTPFANEYLNSLVAEPIAPEKPAFALNHMHIKALEQIKDGMVPVRDIFMADALREIDEAQPLWLNLVPSNTEGAYFDAALAPMGVTELCDAYPKIFAVPNAATKNIAEATPASTVPTAKKRGAKKGVPVSAAGERKVAASAASVRLRNGEPSKGGRPAKGNKSLRELVLAEIRTILASDTVSPKEAHKMIAVKLAVKTTQVQNAFFKLAAAGFLATKENGRVASPLALIKQEYATNHGKNLKAEIADCLKTGAADITIARELGCDLAWVRDVRVGRGYVAKAKVEETL